MRDKGWIETKSMIAAGINSGHVLEIGPGPGIKGLEWLKITMGTKLTALEISQDMIKIAEQRFESIHEDVYKKGNKAEGNGAGIYNIIERFVHS